MFDETLKSCMTESKIAHFLIKIATSNGITDENHKLTGIILKVKSKGTGCFQTLMYNLMHTTWLAEKFTYTEQPLSKKKSMIFFLEMNVIHFSGRITESTVTNVGSNDSKCGRCCKPSHGVLGSIVDNRIDKFANHTLQHQPWDITTGNLLQPFEMLTGVTSVKWRAQQHEAYYQEVNPNGDTALVGFLCPIPINDNWFCILPWSFLQDAEMLCMYDLHKAKLENSSM